MILWMYFLLFCVILQQMLQLQQLLQFFLKTIANFVEYTCIRRNYRTIIASNYNSMQRSTEYYIFSLKISAFRTGKTEYQFASNFRRKMRHGVSYNCVEYFFRRKFQQIIIFFL